jgi:hypothetical protein
LAVRAGGIGAHLSRKKENIDENACVLACRPRGGPRSRCAGVAAGTERYKFMARVNNFYIGQSTDIEYNYGTLPAYDLVGLRFGLIGVSAYLFADNLTNKRAQLGINTTGFSWTIPSLERVATNQPRTVGAEIKYSF